MMPRRVWLAVALFLLIGANRLAAASVTVVDPKGDPVEGARIQFLTKPQGSDVLSSLLPPFLEAKTDADGRIVVPLPRAQHPLLLLIDHPDFAPLAEPLPLDYQSESVYRLTSKLVWASEIAFDAPSLKRGRICALWKQELEEWRTWKNWQRCSEVSAKGSFELRGMPPSAVDLSVTASGFLPLERRLRPNSDVQLRLEPGVALRGQVNDEAGTPVGDASVRATGALEVTDRTGAFTIAVPALPTILAVEAPGFRSREVRVSKIDPENGLLIRLVPGEELQGAVIGAENRPMEEIALWLERFQPPSRWTMKQHHRKTNEGQFTLDLPGPGRYRLRIGAEGYRQEMVPEFSVVRGESFAVGVVVLSLGAGVRGNVIDALSGEPVAGAEIQVVVQGVRLVRDLARRSFPRGVSDAEGDFQITGLAAGRYELRVRRDGYAPALKIANLEQDRMEDVGDMALDRGATLWGRLVDRTGRPRSGLVLRLFDSEGSSLLEIAECTSDAEGRFSGPRLAAGEYRLSVFGRRLLLTQNIDIPEGEEEYEVELVVGGVFLRGLVTRHHEPVEGGLLILQQALDPGSHRGKILVEGPAGEQQILGAAQSRMSTEIGTDGTFALEDAPAGALWATVLATDNSQVTRQILIPDRPDAFIAIELAGLSLRGRVTSRVSGQGVSATIQLLTLSGQTVATVSSTVEGLFAVPDLEPGVFMAEVTAPGYVGASIPGVEVAQGGQPLEIRLEPGKEGSLLVRLRLPDASPGAAIRTTLINESGRMVRAVPTDPYGEQRFDNLQAGTYYLVWTNPVTGTGLSPPIPVGEEQRAVMDETLPAGVALMVACAPDSCGGAAIDFLALYAAGGVEIGRFLSGVASAMRFSSEGRVNLGAVSPGRYVLQLWTHGQKWEKVITPSSGFHVVQFP